MLSAFKILFLILGVIFLAVGIFGRFLSADIIGLLLIVVAFIIDSNAKTHPGTAKSVASLFVVLLGFFLFAVTQFLGALPNLDTTGETPTSATAIGVTIAAIVIVGGLFFINRRKN